LTRDFDATWQPGTPPATWGETPGPDRFDVHWGDQVWRGLPLPLFGAHQARNASQAVVALELLHRQGWPISPQALHAGLQRVQWPGRIEVVAQRPVVVLDAAHNVPAVEALVETLQARFRARRRILIFAASRDKDVAGMLRQLLPAFDHVLLAEFAHNPRAQPVDELAQLARSLGRTDCEAPGRLADAWTRARTLATPDDLICVTGSFFTIGELRPHLTAPG